MFGNTKLSQPRQEGLENVAIAGAAAVPHLIIAVPVVGYHKLVFITPFYQGVHQLSAGLVQEVMLLADDIELNKAAFVGQGSKKRQCPDARLRARQ